MKKIAIDFDGVIHPYSKGWQDGQLYDDPVEGTKESLAILVKSGYYIVIFTTRLNDEENNNVPELKQRVLDYLFKNRILEGEHWHEITCKKPNAIAYIDDRAIRFTNWKDIEKYFK